MSLRIPLIPSSSKGEWKLKAETFPLKWFDRLTMSGNPAPNILDSSLRSEWGTADARLHGNDRKDMVLCARVYEV